MSESVLVVWDEVMASYDFGPTHPLRPLRLDLTMALAREVGVLSAPHVRVASPSGSGDDVLPLVHDRDYIAVVKQAPDDLARRMEYLRWGLGLADNPVFQGMHESAALVTQASVDAARAVWEGTAQHAVNLAGGLHHAKADKAAGFCVYDDPAVAIAWLLQAGAERVAYVDVDVHHGDGVQAAFYDDPRVLTISLHETGKSLFPGTGFPEEVGRGAGVGTSVNVALPVGTDDGLWLRAVDAIVPPALAAFRPQVLVTQLGCDTHAMDPLAHLLCTVDGHREAYRMLHRLAHELCDGRWVVLGGGGYKIVQVVPRSWTHALAEVVGADLPGETPEEWRAYAGERGRQTPPRWFTDGRPVSWRPWDGGNEEDALDRAVMATRRQCFPLLGIEP